MLLGTFGLTIPATTFTSIAYELVAPPPAAQGQRDVANCKSVQNALKNMGNTGQNAFAFARAIVTATRGCVYQCRLVSSRSRFARQFASDPALRLVEGSALV